MKGLFVILVLFIPLIIFSQVLFKKNEIYIFARSTESKINIIAEDFNLRDKFITHLGIGYFENDSIKIYNVSNINKNNHDSSLIVENYESFIDLKDIKYVSIWSIKSKKCKMEIFKKSINSFCNLRIDFDNNFILNNDNLLYCSEFVYKVLKLTDNKKFHFEPINKKLNQFYRSALKRDELVYIPVDFYQSLNFKKVIEFNNLK